MPIRWRLTFFNALAIGSILAVLGLALFFVFRQQQVSSVESTVETRAREAAETLEVGGSGPNTRVTLDTEEVEQLTLDGVFILVRDTNGDVLTQTVNLSSGGEDRDSVWREAAASGRPASGTALLSREAPDYVYALPITQDGQILVLEAGRSYAEAEEVTEGFAAILASALGVALLVAIAGAYLLARTALRPVDTVVSAAREMTEGDLSRRLPVVNQRDEIGRLATTMNGLLARLEAAFARREEVLAYQRRFAADASHELRTPVTAIRGHSRMLKKWGLEEPKTARRGIDAIEAESERLERLVESLLVLTRGDDGAPLEADVNDLAVVAAEAVATVKATAGDRVRVEYGGPPGGATARFDRSRVREAATILLDNAVKYTPDGGRVEARVAQREDEVMLEVSDTGVGIKEDELPLVFERFYRVDSSRTEEGAGLGLSIARQISESHGGRLEASSVVGEGSTFTLTLPRHVSP